MGRCGALAATLPSAPSMADTILHRHRSLIAGWVVVVPRDGNLLRQHPALDARRRRASAVRKDAAPVLTARVSG